MKSSKKRTWITILLILAVCIAGAGIYLAESRKKSEEAVSDAEEIETDTVVYQGKKYRYNSCLLYTSICAPFGRCGRFPAVVGEDT